MEFCAHIVRSFTISTKATRVERALDALSEMGSSVGVLIATMSFHIAQLEREAVSVGSSSLSSCFMLGHHKIFGHYWSAVMFLEVHHTRNHQHCRLLSLMTVCELCYPTATCLSITCCHIYHWHWSLKGPLTRHLVVTVVSSGNST